MKKLICLLTVMLLVLTIPTMVLATEEDDSASSHAWQMWDAICQDSNKNYHSQLALNITYDEPTGRIILSGQTSPLVQQYLKNIQKYQEAYPSVTCSVKMVVDFQFNDQPWYSEYLNESMQVSEIFKHEYILSESESDSFVFAICNVQNYRTELDINNVLGNIIEYRNEVPYIDFTQHTLRAKVKVVFVFDSPETFLEAEDANDIISVYHNKKLDVEIAIPDVNVNHTVYNTHDKKVLVALQPSAEIDSLLLSQHHIELHVHYGIGDDWSDAYIIPAQYQTSTYSFDVPPISYTNDEPVILKLQWNDVTAGTSSEYVNSTAELKHTPDFDTNEDIVHISDNRCPLCKKCNTPSNVCLWIWISAGIALTISVISFTIFIIISVRKKPNTNKENVHA